MADNVASLFGSVPIGAPRVMPDVVECLEALLAMARDGKLHGFLYATVEADGTVGCGWCGEAEHFRMIAAVNCLFFRVNSETKDG